MKKSLIFLVYFFAVVMMVNAQPPIDHRVTKGESVWEVSQIHHNSGAFWEKISKDNNLTIKSGPNPNWYYPDIKPGDILKIYPLNPEPEELQPQTNPTNSLVGTDQASTEDSWFAWFTWSWFWFLIVIFLLIMLFYTGIKGENNEEKLKKEKEEAIASLTSKNDLLMKENEELRKKIPVEAPALATTDWLEKNNPVGTPIPNEPTAEAITKAFGKYPHLVIQAKVTTHPESAEMGFSHNRKALTGLDGVVAYLGWNWDNETKTWNEVGYVAGPCANGFVFTPEAIEKGMTFSKIELVDPSKNPVIMTDIKADAPKYPELIWPLVQEYHRLNITEQRMAGMVVYVPKPKKTPVAETQAKTNLN